MWHLVEEKHFLQPLTGHLFLFRVHIIRYPSNALTDSDSDDDDDDADYYDDDDG